MLLKYSIQDSHVVASAVLRVPTESATYIELIEDQDEDACLRVRFPFAVRISQQRASEKVWLMRHELDIVQRQEKPDTDWELYIRTRHLAVHDPVLTCPCTSMRATQPQLRKYPYIPGMTNGPPAKLAR